MSKIKILEYKSKDDKEGSLYKAKLNGEFLTMEDPNTKKQIPQIFETAIGAENAAKVEEVSAVIRQAMPKLSKEGVHFLAVVSLDSHIQLKVVLNAIIKYYDENVEEPDTEDFPFEHLTASVRGRGLASTAKDFLMEEGTRDIAKDIDFFVDAFVAMELGTHPEPEIEPEIVKAEGDPKVLENNA